jgi:hypothetical protein
MFKKHNTTNLESWRVPFRLREARKFKFSWPWGTEGPVTSSRGWRRPTRNIQRPARSVLDQRAIFDTYTIYAKRWTHDICPGEKGEIDSTIVAKFLALTWRYSWLWPRVTHRPARLHRLAGWYEQPYARADNIPYQGLRIWLQVAMYTLYSHYPSLAGWEGGAGGVEWAT